MLFRVHLILILSFFFVPALNAAEPPLKISNISAQLFYESSGILSKNILGVPFPEHRPGTTNDLYRCRASTDCRAGSYCVDNNGDKVFFCKPKCETDTDCAELQARFSGIQCSPAYFQDQKKSTTRICNERLVNVIDYRSDASSAGFHGWNTVIGEGSADEPANNMLVVVHLQSNGHHFIQKPLKIEVFGNNKLITQEKQSALLTDAKGRVAVPVWVKDMGCAGNVIIRVDLAGSIVEESLSFDCGE